MLCRKSISPVIATALLLVVGVVAVVSFQTWFGIFSSKIFADTQSTTTNNLGNTQIEELQEFTLYFKNGNNENITITKIKVEDTDCNISGSYAIGISEIDLGTCLNTLTTHSPKIIVYTNEGIYSEVFYLKELLINDYDDCTLDSQNVTHNSSYIFYNTSTVSYGGNCNLSSLNRTCYDGTLNGDTSYSYSSCTVESLNCSALGLAGGTWITVPGNSDIGTTDFCVMKYEARQLNSSHPTSIANSTPWSSITQAQARTACSALGSNYNLITNVQWTTIARNIEHVGSNWNTSVVGSGWIFSGHNDNGPSSVLNASFDDNDGYYRTNDNLSSCDGVYSLFGSTNDTISGLACAGQKRTLFLNNSELIWDLAGNIGEWNNDTCTQGDPWYSGGWIEWTDSNVNTVEKTSAGPIGNYTASNGVGRYIGCSSNGNGLIRGGIYSDGSYAGVHLLAFNQPPIQNIGWLGFRCTYTP